MFKQYRPTPNTQIKLADTPSVMGGSHWPDAHTPLSGPNTPPSLLFQGISPVS